MTKAEFKHLKVGDVVISKDGEQYRIKLDWVHGPPNQVFYAERIKPDTYRAIQVSEGNMQFWEKI